LFETARFHSSGNGGYLIQLIIMEQWQLVKKTNNMYSEKKHFKMIKKYPEEFSSGQPYIAGYRM
jgi:hypothetical protein